MSVGSEFAAVSCEKMCESLTASFTWGVLTPFRNAPVNIDKSIDTSQVYFYYGEAAPLLQLNYGRVFAAELGYLVMLVAATVEFCVRGVFALFVIPFVCFGCVSHESASFVWTYGGAINSGLTAMNCATALYKNFYEVRLKTNDFCLDESIESDDDEF